MPGKRALDLLLVVLAAPLLLAAIALLATCVLAADGRPILFSQVRVGRAGRLFRIRKLRTMTNDANESRRRPTRLGAWLRARGLDELPQAWNVARGEMSVVGPRPLSVHDHLRLLRECPALAARLDVPPGITGLAQVRQARGAAATAALDAEYARRRGARLDLELLGRTLWINLVGKRRGAWR